MTVSAGDVVIIPAGVGCPGARGEPGPRHRGRLDPVVAGRISAGLRRPARDDPPCLQAIAQVASHEALIGTALYGRARVRGDLRRADGQQPFTAGLISDFLRPIRRASISDAKISATTFWNPWFHLVIGLAPGAAHFRGDAAFAIAVTSMSSWKPRVTSTRSVSRPRFFREASIAHLLTRPVGRPPNHVRRFHASFSYQAAYAWNRKRRVLARVEWHPGELVPRVGFIVTNLTRPAERVVFLLQPAGHSGTAYQGRQECHLRWTRLSCQQFRTTR